MSNNVVKEFNSMWNVLVTDVDGVLTNGRFLYDSNGKCLKEFGPNDGDAVKFFRALGVPVHAISADKRGFGITKRRLGDMGVEVSLVSEKDRLSWVQERFSGEKIAFIGDGYFDIPVLRIAERGYAPANAIEVVKNNADKVLKVSGGEGVLLAVFEDYLYMKDQSAYETYMNGNYRSG